MTLDTLDLIASTSYLVLLAGAIVAFAPQTASLRRLTLAVRLLTAAIAVKILDIAFDIPDLPDSAVTFGVSVLVLVAGVVTLVFIVRRRRLKGEQVVAEAERTVRSWQPFDSTNNGRPTR